VASCQLLGLNNCAKRQFLALAKNAPKSLSREVFVPALIGTCQLITRLLGDNLAPVAGCGGYVFAAAAGEADDDAVGLAEGSGDFSGV
jgi:hypothetical protein